MIYSGCLHVEASRINEPIKITSREISVQLCVTAYSMCNELLVSAKSIGKKPLISCSLICSINKSAFINVVPDTLWLTPDMLASAEFEIKSNTSWFIN